MKKSPMEKVTLSEAKETGCQNLGSRPYHYAFWYTRFRHSFVLPEQSTTFWNNYPFISISKEQNLWPDKYIRNAANIHVHVQCFTGTQIFGQKQLGLPMLEHTI